MTKELEERLVGLRDRVALLYDEDLAQEMFIRMVLNPELTDSQVLTKAKWLSRDNIRRESRYVLITEETIDSVWNYDDTDRIHARIELQRLYKKSKRIVKLIRVELGLYVISRQRESFVRAVNRVEEGE